MKRLANIVTGLVTCIILSTTTQAATITVDTTSDDSFLNGNCTLRDAVHSAMDDIAVDNCIAGSGDDSIEFDPAVTGIITLTASINVITENLTITGPGSGNLTVDANGANFRVFTIDSPGDDQTVNISGLTISGGNPTTGGGAGIYVLAGDTLNLNASTVSDNMSGYRGAGIYISTGSSVTITDSTISNNTVTGANSYGGGIATWGDLFISNSEVSGNTSQDEVGGGIFIGPTGRVWLTDSTVSGNQTPSATGGAGAGIFNGSGELTITGSTISGNSSNRAASGIQQQGTATITNSTISGNMGGSGMGIWASGVSTSFSNVAIVANTGTGYYHFQTATFQNTIIANNGTDCIGTSAGTFTSNGNNLDSDDTCNFTHVNDLPNTDPLLGPLQDNGGPTQTHALLSSSPAIDGGDPGGCLDHAGVVLATDQRGEQRPLDGDSNGSVICDIGAYEFVLPPDINVTDPIAPNDDLQMAFGEVNTGSSSIQAIVTLANQGHRTLTVSNVVVSGADAGLFNIDFSAGATPCNGLSIVIAGGQNCTLGITFSPQSVGAKSASVDINSNDPDEGTVNVALSGTGVTPPPPAGAGGGGCTISKNAAFDPLLPLMMAFSGIYLLLRRKV